jgi:spermidine synthase
LSLSAEPPQDFDVLAMDAFSNDTIPTHLLTAEAFQVYLRHLRPDGILAVNVSSPYFDLRPVLRAVAEASGLSGMLVESQGNEAALTYAADWVLLTRNAEVFNRPRLRAAASPAWQGVKPLLWTDDFVSLPGLLGRLPTSGS